MVVFLLFGNVQSGMYEKRKLTDLPIKQEILKLKDSTKTVKLYDSGGMYLQIQPND